MDNTIDIPSGITTAQQLLAYMVSVTNQAFGSPDGTIRLVAVGGQFAQTTIVSPIHYQPAVLPNPPQTVDSQPWVPPAVAPPPYVPWNCAVFKALQLGNSNWYWGSPCSSNLGSTNDFFLIGGQIDGVPCVAKAPKSGGSWTVINNTVPFVIQEMIYDFSANAFIGRGVGQSNFLKSTDNGVTWTLISNTPTYQGFGAGGFLP